MCVKTVITHIKFEKNYYFIFKCLNKIWWDGSVGKGTGCQVYGLSSNPGTLTEEENQSQVVSWPTLVYYGKHKEDKTKNREEKEKEGR